MSKKTAGQQTPTLPHEIADLLQRFDATRCQSLRRRLVRWYELNARDLPWRRTADAYHIWISEIMLQQTTVKAVIPYYERFLARFDSLTTLANAEESEVLKHWEGLGYYSRGRNIHAAAKVLCSEYDGAFPQDVKALQSLPGIGRYTAGAICSFAFDLKAPIVEANTLRLYSRLLGYEGDPRSRQGQELLWAFAEQILPAKNPGRINQALMELGSLVCTPTDPHCDQCPLQQDCAAHATGQQESIPAKKVRSKTTFVVETSVAIRGEGRFLVRMRGPEERWAGMWDFYRFPIESVTYDQKLSNKTSPAFEAEVSQKIHEQSGLKTEVPELFTEILHSVTRYRIRLLCMLCDADISGKNKFAPQNNLSQNLEASSSSVTKWVSLQELHELPMPITTRRFVKMLEEKTLF